MAPLTICDAVDGEALTRRPLDVLVADELIERLARIHARAARVVELRFFAGATTEQAARLLEVSLGTVEGDWRFARAWLTAELTRRDTAGASDGAPSRGHTGEQVGERGERA